MDHVLLGKIVATALLGLEEATQAFSAPGTVPVDVGQFVSGIYTIWFQKNPPQAPAVAPIA